MNDPLYRMTPDNAEWDATLAEEAEDFSTALYQQDRERADRKAKELHHAFHLLASQTGDTADAAG